MRTSLKISACFLLASALSAQDSPSSAPTSPDFSPSTLPTTSPLLSPGATLLLTNSVYTGSFLKRVDRQEQLTSTLTLTPFVTINNLFDDKKLKISGEQKINFNWLQPQSTKAAPSEKWVLSDFILRAALKDAFAWNSTGLSLTPSLELEAPVSKPSRDSNRYVGLGTALQLGWAINGFSLSYKPLLTGFINGAPSDPVCDATNNKSAQACTPAARQTRLMLKNTVIAKYSAGNHSVAATFRLYDAFLRPLASDGQAKNLNESTLGVLEYNYTIPLRFPLALTLGVSSFQPSRNAKGVINFPFFDFMTPANNYSQIYFEMELALS